MIVPRLDKVLAKEKCTFHWLAKRPNSNSDFSIANSLDVCWKCSGLFEASEDSKGWAGTLCPDGSLQASAFFARSHELDLF